MAIKVEIDISLPIGSGPDGHIQLVVSLPDLAYTEVRDREYILALIDKAGSLLPPGTLTAETAGAAPVLRDLANKGGRA